MGIEELIQEITTRFDEEEKILRVVLDTGWRLTQEGPLYLVEQETSGFGNPVVHIITWVLECFPGFPRRCILSVKTPPLAVSEELAQEGLPAVPGLELQVTGAGRGILSLEYNPSKDFEAQIRTLFQSLIGRLQT